MIKLIALVSRRPDLTVDEFARYWIDVHAPLAAAQEPLGYSINVRTEHQPDDALGDVDGVAEIWWRDYGHMEAGLSSSAGVIAAADVANFADSVRFVVATEHEVIPAPRLHPP